MKSYLNNRQFEILSTLLNEEGPITVGDLSRHLNLKPRIIQYNLNSIDCWLKNNNINILHRTGIGLFIDLSKEERSHILDQLSDLVNIELVFSTKERRRILMIYILEIGRTFSSTKLSLDFNVTRTTILKDLDFIKEYLDRHQLELIRLPRKGYEIRGSVAHKRFVICKLLCEEHFENKISLNNVEDLFNTKMPFKFIVDEWFQFSDIEFSLKSLKKIELLLNENFSQGSLIALFYYSIHMLKDIRRGNQIIGMEISEVNWFKEALLIFPFRKSLEDYTKIAIVDSELQTLVLHCHCQARFLGSLANIEREKSIYELFPPSNQLIAWGQELTKEISLFLNPYLQIEKDFQIELTDFLEKCLTYRKYGFSLNNPFSSEIRAMFGDTYDTLEKIINRNVHDEISLFNENELSILTSLTISAINRIQQIIQKELKVILISSGDRPMTSFMKERVSNNFPWFNIIDTLRPADITKEKIKDANLILTTDNICVDGGIPTIYVEPFITGMDIENIQNWILDHTKQKSIGIGLLENTGLNDLLLEENITIANRVDGWEDAVYLAGKPLIESGAIEESYLEAIIKVNRTHGPYSVIAPNIALLHAKPIDGVNKLCMGLLILKQGVRFGAKKFDPVRIVFIIGMQGAFSHLNVLHDFIRIIRAKRICERLAQCETPQEVKKELK
jgi:transcriptional antiterminator/mannitol/fructose-specific phosphotransferase system IIA component (Ntr-type)